MSVRALDKNGDWTFGAGKANYISGKPALNQKVTTRLKSFKNDNPLNMDDNIDWLGLLSRRGTEDTILKEIERVTLQTPGVIEITNISAATKSRKQTTSLSYVTIYDDEEVTTELTDL